jgi:hypothetical protein
MYFMKNKQRRSQICAGLLLILGFAFAINYSYYTKAAASERGNISITISTEALPTEEKPFMIDRASLGHLKNLVQPDKYAARYTIKNESQESIPIQIKAVETAGKITFETGAATFEKPSDHLSSVIKPGQSLRVNIAIDLSNISPEQHLLGKVQIIDEKNDIILGTTPIHLINSNMNTTTTQANEEHHHHEGGSK